MVRISAVILTFNEEDNIARCIESVLAVADEIIVIDSYSTDKTADICRKYHQVKFITHPFEGYIEQKNYAITQASNDQILSLDADEALSPELAKEIIRVKNNFTSDAYTMNRLTSYCGKWIRHSGWYPDVKLRLFKKDAGRWTGLNPHDVFMLHEGKSGSHLSGDILHYSYYSVAQHKQQIEKFAAIAAQSLYNNGNRSDILKLIYKPVARFIKSYIIRQGFRDGKEGFVIASLTAWSSWLRYKNLRDIQRANHEKRI